MEGIAVLAILTLLIILIWFSYYFGYRILDASSSVRSADGTVVEKEYIPSHSKVVNKTVVRNHGDSGFESTRYDIPDEIQVAEEYLFHIDLNGRLIVTPVTDKLYDSTNQGDRIFVKYSQGRFSKRIYLKEIKPLQKL